MKPATERNVAHNFILLIQSLEDHFVTNKTSLEKTKVHRTEFGTPLVAEMVNLAKAEHSWQAGIRRSSRKRWCTGRFAKEPYRQTQTRPKCVNPNWSWPFDGRIRCC